jgi:hypothetical protein
MRTENEATADTLVRMVNEADELCILDLRMGGDGDPGEILAELLTNFLNEGRITLIIND